MNYKLFLPKGARAKGNKVILENGLSFPRYAFVAIPIVGTKGNTDNDILSELETDPVWFDTQTNSFTLTKKTREIDQSRYQRVQFPSLSTSTNEEAEVNFNYDGYINISKLISQVKAQVTQIKEYESRLVVFEQDIGYTTVRQNNQISFKIGSIETTDNYESRDYVLSTRLKLADLLISQVRPQTLQPQNGVSTKIIVRNLKNLALNVYDPILEYLIPDSRSVEIFSAYTEGNMYAADEEFYLGEAIQLRFPGASSAAIYLYAKELASLLLYSKLYLEYYLDKEPRITIMLPAPDNPSPATFATRFEHNIIHAGRLINIDKNFDDRDSLAVDNRNGDSMDANDGEFITTSGPNVYPDGRLNSNISLVPLNITRDRLPLQNFIKDAIKKGYVQSEEEAIKFAFITNINISDVVITNHQYREDKIKKNPGKPDELDDPRSDLNKVIQSYLPNLINCPPVANGSVTGLPDQTIFPMMSASQFRPITDPTMIYNPDKTIGQLGVPQHIRFNNPLLVATVDGVTNKPEDGYIGDVAGKAVYSNRLGGLCAGLRLMGGAVSPGMSLQAAVTTAVPPANLLQVVASLTQAMFGVTDPTGAMLGCAQVPTTGTDPNMMIVMLATMMAAATQRSTSPMTYEEIKLAQEHLSGENTSITRTPAGNKIDDVRDPSKEQPNVITKTDQDAATTPKDLNDTTINSTQKVIFDDKGVELETKSERKTGQETTYIKYDSGTNHEDNLTLRGSSSSTIGDIIEDIMV